MNWIVRAGHGSAQSLMAGYRPHAGIPALVGCSVQYAPGRSIEELARAGRFKHAHISYATDTDVEVALGTIGYAMKLVSSPGLGYHHTLVVLFDGNGARLLRLPFDAAQAISSTFQRRVNPYPVP